MLPTCHARVSSLMNAYPTRFREFGPNASRIENGIKSVPRPPPQPSV